jgi:hypothetical protein
MYNWWVAIEMHLFCQGAQESGAANPGAGPHHKSILQRSFLLHGPLSLTAAFIASHQVLSVYALICNHLNSKWFLLPSVFAPE